MLVATCLHVLCTLLASWPACLAHFFSPTPLLYYPTTMHACGFFLLSAEEAFFLCLSYMQTSWIILFITDVSFTHEAS